MPISWPDEVDEIVGGDLTTGLAYVTPAGGVVVTAVAPIGLRDRAAGTMGFTTSLGLGRKLERIARNRKVALAYHAREHGFSDRPGFVLAQGAGSFEAAPQPGYLEDVIGPHAERFMGPPKRGRLFWDRWLREYYQDRVPVTVAVERVLAWPDRRCERPVRVHGADPPAEPPAPQAEPRKGAGPRVDVERLANRLDRLPHRLLGFVSADGHPDVMPVDLLGAGAEGLVISAGRALPPGGRRAGLLGHRYNPRLIGLETRTCTGWLTVENGRALYAPHTDSGFRTPANKTLLLLANGLVAKRGLRRARRAGAGTATGQAAAPR